MKDESVTWNVKRTLDKLHQLVEPGVIGNYRSVEVTEFVGVDGSSFTNLLTLVVAEPVEAPLEIEWQKVLLNSQKRHKLKGTKYNIGIAQYRLSLESFLGKVTEFVDNNKWGLSPIDIKTGKLVAVPAQFVPSDGSKSHSWNSILKNNFFEGSHVLELFDTTKEHLRFLFDDSRRLTALAEIVGQYVPVKLDGMSDRLGNIIVQLPVTIMSTKVRGSSEGDHSVTVVWHPDIAPRRVRIAAEIWHDETVTNYDSAVTYSGEVKLRLNSPGGGARTHIWDEEKKILLSAAAPVRFVTSMSISMSVHSRGSSPLNREFTITDFSGEQVTQSLLLKEGDPPRQIIGSSPEDPREPWTSQRIFGESIASLKARKEFVQYGLAEGNRNGDAEYHNGASDAASIESGSKSTTQKHVRRMAALKDLHWLMERHGDEGVWLWDPYLDAKDVLRTLFFCPYSGVQLRALTAGKVVKGKDSEPVVGDSVSERDRRKLAREKARERSKQQSDWLEEAKGNCHGLQLEFRIRSGGAGWGFHDRFIIFPRAQGAALAWSLGTSINSFGDEHHILQKVLHGEPIAQAFQDLWGQLEGKRHLIWKS